MNNEQIDRLTLESAITDVLIADEENKAKSTPSQMAGDIVDLYNIRINQNHNLNKKETSL